MTEARAELSNQNMNQTSANTYVDLAYLADHLAEFENLTVTTNGTVRRDIGSIYMFENFWLQAQDGAKKIMVVTRYANLTVPSNGSRIEVSGIIQHSDLEGGFYFLNATSWRDEVLPEFPSIMLPLLVLFSSSFLLYFCSSKGRLRLKGFFKKTQVAPDEEGLSARYYLAH